MVKFNKEKKSVKVISLVLAILIVATALPFTVLNIHAGNTWTKVGEKTVSPASYSTPAGGMYSTSSSASAGNTYTITKIGDVYTVMNTSGKFMCIDAEGAVTWTDSEESITLVSDASSNITAYNADGVAATSAINGVPFYSVTTGTETITSTESGYVYTLDTDGFEAGSDNQYLIVGANNDNALSNDGGVSANVSVTVTGNTITMEDTESQWYLTDDPYLYDGTYYINFALSDGATIGVKKYNYKAITVSAADQANGLYYLYNAGSSANCFIYYSGTAWGIHAETDLTASTATNPGTTYAVRMFKYTGQSTGGTTTYTTYTAGTQFTTTETAAVVVSHYVLYTDSAVTVYTTADATSTEAAIRAGSSTLQYSENSDGTDATALSMDSEDLYFSFSNIDFETAGETEINVYYYDNTSDNPSSVIIGTQTVIVKEEEPAEGWKKVGSAGTVNHYVKWTDSPITVDTTATSTSVEEAIRAGSSTVLFSEHADGSDATTVSLKSTNIVFGVDYADFSKTGEISIPVTYFDISADTPDNIIVGAQTVIVKEAETTTEATTVETTTEEELGDWTYVGSKTTASTYSTPDSGLYSTSTSASADNCYYLTKSGDTYTIKNTSDKYMNIDADGNVTWGTTAQDLTLTSDANSNITAYGTGSAASNVLNGVKLYSATSKTTTSEAGYKYTLDTDGIDYDQPYLIVAPTSENILYSNSGSVGDYTDFDIVDNTITLATDAYDWTFTVTNESKTPYEAYAYDGSYYLYASSSSLTLSTTSKNIRVQNCTNGYYQVFRKSDVNYYSINYSNGWTATSISTLYSTSDSTTYLVRLFKYTEEISGGTSTEYTSGSQFETEATEGTTTKHYVYYTSSNVTVANGLTKTEIDAAIRAGASTLQHSYSSFGTDATTIALSDSGLNYTDGLSLITDTKVAGTYTFSVYYTDSDVDGAKKTYIGEQILIIKDAETTTAETTTEETTAETTTEKVGDWTLVATETTPSTYSTPGSGFYSTSATASASNCYTLTKSGDTYTIKNTSDKYMNIDASGNVNWSTTEQNITLTSDADGNITAYNANGVAATSAINGVPFYSATKSTEDVTTESGYVYTLDTDGIDAGSNYLIVGATDDIAMARSSRTITTASATITGDTAIVSSTDNNWAFNDSDGYYKISNTGTGTTDYYLIMPTSDAGTLTAKTASYNAQDHTVSAADQSNGLYYLYYETTSANYFCYYNSGWTTHSTSTSVTDPGSAYAVRLYKYTGTSSGGSSTVTTYTSGTKFTPTETVGTTTNHYVRYTSSSVTVANGLSVTAIDSAIRAGASTLQHSYSSDGADATTIALSDSGLNYTDGLSLITDTTVSGTYTFSVYYTDSDVDGAKKTEIGEQVIIISAAEPTTAETTTAETTTAETTTAETTTEEPVTEPSTEEPVTEPSTEEPVTEPSTEPSTAPTTTETTTEPTTAPTTTETTTAETTTEPTTVEPTTEPPTTSRSTTDAKIRNWKKVANAGNGATVTIYEKSDTISSGDKFIISASGDSTHVLNSSFSASTVDAANAAGKTGYMDSDGNEYTASNPYYVENDTLTPCVFTYNGGVQNVSNSNYLARNTTTKTAVTSSTSYTAISTGTNTLFSAGTRNSYYLYYSNSTFAYQTSSGNVNFYVAKTLSSSSEALYVAMTNVGKTVRVDSLDEITERFSIYKKSGLDGEETLVDWTNSNVSYTTEAVDGEENTYLLTVKYGKYELGQATVILNETEDTEETTAATTDPNGSENKDWVDLQDASEAKVIYEYTDEVMQDGSSYIIASSNSGSTVALLTAGTANTPSATSGITLNAGGDSGYLDADGNTYVPNAYITVADASSYLFTRSGSTIKSASTSKYLKVSGAGTKTLKLEAASGTFTFASNQIYSTSGTSKYYIYYNNSTFAISTTSTNKVYLYKQVTLYPEAKGSAALSLSNLSYNILNGTSFGISDIQDDVDILYKDKDSDTVTTIAWTDSKVSYSWDETLDTSTNGTYKLTVTYDGKELGDITVKVYKEEMEAGEVRLNKKVSDKTYLMQTGVSKVELSVDATPPYYQKNVDVVFICDVSNSMVWKPGTKTDSDVKSEQKLGLMEDSITSFSNTVLQNSVGTGMENNNTVSMCTFGGTNSISKRNIIVGSSSASAVDTAVHNINMKSGYYISFDGSTPTTSSPGGTDYVNAFQQGQTLVTDLKSQYKTETGVDYDSTDRQLFVIFMTDGAPQTYNGVDRSKYSTADAWYNYISNNNESNATNLYNNYGIDDFDVIGIDLDYGGFATSSNEYWIFTKDDDHPLCDVLENLVEGQTLDVYFADTATEIANSLLQETTAVLKLGTNVTVEDKLGENFGLQMKSTIASASETISLSEYSITPSITLSKYPTYHLSDVTDGTCTAAQVGQRIPDTEPTIIEQITFNADGTEAYSSVIGSSTNILSDGVICGNQIMFNTTDTDKTVNGITVKAQSFYWNLQTFSEDRLTLSYYVYLDGSMDYTTEDGDYDTNEYAKISYTTSEGEDTEDVFPVPHLFWQNPSLNPDTVVVDYGIPVVIDITGNDEIANCTVTGIGTGIESGTQLGNVGYSSSKLTGKGTSLTLSHGTATYQSADDTIKFALSDMQMDDADVIYYECYCSATQKYYYSTVTVVPAQNIYYEESFMTFTDGQGDMLKWFDAGDGITDALQAQDRPGKNFSSIDEDNVYGYDDAYNSDVSTYSLDTAKVTYVTGGSFGKEATASFTFCGTGFDLFSVTDAKSGCAWVVIKNNSTGKTVIRVVDAYYGYSYGRLYADENGEPTFDSTGRVLYQSSGKDAVRLGASYIESGTAGDRVVDEPRYYSVNSTADDIITTTDVTYYATTSTDDNPVYTSTATYYDANGNITTTVTDEPAYAYAYAYAYGWLATDDEYDALYQVPVVRERGLTYGSYTVTVIPTYAAMFDADNDNVTKFFIDGVRIYDPCGTADDILESDKTVVEEAYKADDEWDAQYIELRSNIIDATNSFFTAESIDGQAEAQYALFIDGFSALNSYSSDEDSDAMEKYVEAGPNNELYLAKNQAVTFKLVVNDTEFRPITTLQLGMKVVHEGDDKAYGEVTVISNTPREQVETHTISVSGSAPMFRDLTEYVGWVKTSTGWETSVPLVMINTSDTVVALTDVKWGYDSDIEVSEDAPTPVMSLAVGKDAVEYTVETLNTYVFCTPEEIDLTEITAVWDSTEFEVGAEATLTVTTPDDIVKLQVGDVEITDYVQNENGTRTWTYTVTVTENGDDTYNIIFTDDRGDVSESFTTDPIVIAEEETTEESEADATISKVSRYLKVLLRILEMIKELFAELTGGWK